jgi:nitrite reductase/ring-hydroxylating ferredoxin subunit/uncharacterized membrane protein
MAKPAIDRLVETQGWLDPVGAFIQRVVGGFYGALGSPGRRLKDTMHGSWPPLLGHPLHPALTDIPIGALTVMVIADLVALGGGLPTRAGDVALIVGLLGALAAAITGYTDHHETYGHEQRTATLHGLIMSLALLLLLVSLALRWWAGMGAHGVAVILAIAGWVVIVVGSYLGGHLVFALGTTVNRNAFAQPAAEWIGVGTPADFPEGALRRVVASDVPALVVRLQGGLHAIAATCSHAGGPLDEGSLDGTVVTCPWHGSRFCLRDGTVRGGPATAPQPAFEVREHEGRVELRPLDFSAG